MGSEPQVGATCGPLGAELIRLLEVAGHAEVVADRCEAVRDSLVHQVRQGLDGGQDAGRQPAGGRGVTTDERG